MLRRLVRMVEKDWNNGDMSKDGFQRKRVFATHEARVDAPVEEVFPLACAEPGNLWSAEWKPVLNYSESGKNEYNAMWTEKTTGEVLLRRRGLETKWVNTLYDTARFRFHALLISREATIGKYELEMERTGENATLIRFKLMYTALNQEGNRLLDDSMKERMADLLMQQSEFLAQVVKSGGKPSKALESRLPAVSLPDPFLAKRKRNIFHVETVLKGDPDALFSLACPVAELQWIDDWRFDLIYSESGVNEDNCIFLEPLSGLMVLSSIGLNTWWYTTLYDRENYRFQAVLITPGLVAGKFCFDAKESGPGKVRMTWDITYTGLSPEGNKRIDQKNFEQQIYKMASSVGSFLKYYLEEGKMYKIPSSMILKMGLSYARNRFALCFA